MESPLEWKVPPEDKRLDRVRDYARDLAWGALNNLWEPLITVDSHGNSSHNPSNISDIEDDELTESIIKYSKKWTGKVPHMGLLVSLGYLVKTGERGEKLLHEGTNLYRASDPIPAPFEIEYFLTDKAFSLLEKPATPPSVFISYKQTESSALALLIKSRLKNVDPNVSIFIDKNIPSGESINSQIKESLEQSKFFICLLGSTTLLHSQPVKDEIELANKKPDCTIIPICHNGYTPDTVYAQYFSDNKAIVIKQPDSAEEYETNITKLLIRLGYSTI